MESSFDPIPDPSGEVVGREPKPHGVVVQTNWRPLHVEPEWKMVARAEKIEDPSLGTYYRLGEYKPELRLPTVFDQPDGVLFKAELDLLAMRATAWIRGTQPTEAGPGYTEFDLELHAPAVRVIRETGCAAHEVYHEEVRRLVSEQRDELLTKWGISLNDWMTHLQQARGRGRPTSRTMLDWSRLAMIAQNATDSARRALMESENMSEEGAKDLLKRMRGRTRNPIRNDAGEVVRFLEMSGSANRPTYSATSLARTLVTFSAPPFP